LIPTRVSEQLVRLVTRPVFVENARPYFPRRDRWRTVDDSDLWRMVLSQVCVVGSSAGWDRVKASGDAESALSFASLLKQTELSRAKTIHRVLRRHGVRYVPLDAGLCRKTRALLQNFAFLAELPLGAKGYLQSLAGLPDDRARVQRVTRDFAYVKNKGARDLLIELDLGRTLVAFDVRVLNLLKAAGAQVPDDVQMNKQRYEALQTAVVEQVCKPAGLSGAEFDRVLYRNYDEMISELRKGA
jgi:hypothetical protein